MYSNNPFVENSDPSSRYPDLRQAGQQQQQEPQQFWQGNPGGYSPMVSPGPGQMGQMGTPAHQGYQMQGGYQQSNGGGYGQQMAGLQMAQPTGVGMGMGVAYQLTSSFGQNIHQHLAVQSQQLQQQQQQQQQNALISQFDPYADIGKGWTGPSSLPNSGALGGAMTHGRASSTSALPTAATAASDSGTHPRDMVRKYRTELEKWDIYSWKQFLNSFEMLKSVWEKRRDEAKAKGSAAASQWGSNNPDTDYWLSIAKEAGSQVDTISASLFQVKEVYAGYRHSADTASRGRVREFLNAGLNAVPDMPGELTAPPAANAAAPPLQYANSFSGVGVQQTGAYHPQQQQQQPTFQQQQQLQQQQLQLQQPQHQQYQYHQQQQPQQQQQYGFQQQGYYYG